jgi:hypothetical protein
VTPSAVLQVSCAPAEGLSTHLAYGEAQSMVLTVRCLCSACLRLPPPVPPLHLTGAERRRRAAHLPPAVQPGRRPAPLDHSDQRRKRVRAPPASAPRSARSLLSVTRPSSSSCIMPGQSHVVTLTLQWLLSLVPSTLSHVMLLSVHSGRHVFVRCPAQPLHTSAANVTTPSQVPVTIHLSRGSIGSILEPPHQPAAAPHPPLVMRCCALLLSSDGKSSPFLPADAGDAPVAAAAAAASLALADNRALSPLPLALSIELFLLALAALPSPLLPRAAHAAVCSGGKGAVAMKSLVEAGHASQRQASMFGAVAAAFAAVAHGLPSSAASALVSLLAAAVFHVRCDGCLTSDDVQPVAQRVSAFAHMTNGGSKRLQQEGAFIREQMGLPPR